ncbi:MAG TPA: hypothetical protein VFJ20_01740 [Gemmatimonadaceae bacterium]|nr:hypothetical protein [Gemmatimonadaceae bacterium]
MADDEIRRIEAVFGAISRIASGEEPESELRDARCPKCGKSDFARLSDIYSEAVGRLQEDPAEATVARIAGLSDAQLVEKFRPPERRSAALTVALVAVPMGAVAAFLYIRFGEGVGQLAIGVAIVVTVIVLMTTLRRVSDDYYARRRRWNGLFMCRQCGQVVTS